LVWLGLFCFGLVYCLRKWLENTGGEKTGHDIYSFNKVAKQALALS